MDGEGCSVSESSIKVRNIASIEKSSVFGAARKQNWTFPLTKSSRFLVFGCFLGLKYQIMLRWFLGGREAQSSVEVSSLLFLNYFFTQNRHFPTKPSN